MMLFKIAWRNIWRSKLRSMTVLMAIALGIWAGIFLISFSAGLNLQRTRDALESTIGHVQIHNPKFDNEQRINYWMEDVPVLEQVLDSSSLVKGYSPRVVLNGMVSSANSAGGARIMGIDPAMESSSSNIHEKLIEGTWFEDERKNQIVLGWKLAEKNKLRIKSKVVLSFQDEEGNIVTGLFRVGGIFRTVNSRWDETNVFVRSRDLFNTLGIEPKFHEMVILLKDVEDTEAMDDQLAAADGKDAIKTWKDVAPELAYADEMMSTMLFIFMSIIMIALLFGIVNNMLMAILERRRELGMLMAVGFNKRKLFAMILYETVFLGLVGGPVGIFMGYFSVLYFVYNGADLSIFGEGLESFGLSSIIYPELDTSYYLMVGLMMIVTTVIASIVPAYKALKLNPVEAIRSV